MITAEQNVALQTQYDELGKTGLEDQNYKKPKAITTGT